MLNFGHTVGHAVERLSDYTIRHGEAVAIGLVLAHEFSAELGLASAADAERVRGHLLEAGLPTRIGDLPGPRPGADDLMRAIAQDKKVSRGALTFILTRGIGRCFVARDVPASAVLAFLRDNHPG